MVPEFPQGEHTVCLLSREPQMLLRPVYQNSLAHTKQQSPEMQNKVEAITKTWHLDYSTRRHINERTRLDRI